MMAESVRSMMENEAKSAVLIITAKMILPKFPLWFSNSFQRGLQTLKILRENFAKLKHEG
jgi:hypothetical protein